MEHALADGAIERACSILSAAACPSPPTLTEWAIFFRHELAAQVRLEEARVFPALPGRHQDRLGEEHLAILIAARSLATRLEELGRQPAPSRWRAARRVAGILQVLLERHAAREAALLPC